VLCVLCGPTGLSDLCEMFFSLLSISVLHALQAHMVTHNNSHGQVHSHHSWPVIFNALHPPPWFLRAAGRRRDEDKKKDATLLKNTI
jgi:hypothetical protein